MFNLIVAVISIALIEQKHRVKLEFSKHELVSSLNESYKSISTLINNGQQVSGAQQLYMIDNSGNRANDIDVLTGGGYLQAVPSAPATVINSGAAWDVATNGTFAYIRLDTDNTGQQLSPAATVCPSVTEIADRWP